MEVREVREQDTVSIRTVAPVEKLPKVLGLGYGEIMEYLGSGGVQPAGPPFAMYHNMDMSALDVEFGFPISGQVAAKGRIKPGKLPAGRTAVTLHVGAYDKIHEAYDRLTAFVKEKGLEPAASCYEVYLNDPQDTAPEELQTEIYFPLK